MRTAADWYHTEGGPSLHNLIAGWECDYDEKEVIEYIKQVQLDAVKHGMTIAAEIAVGNNSMDHSSDCQCQICLYRKTILAKRDNLKSIS